MPIARRVAPAFLLGLAAVLSLPTAASAEGGEWVARISASGDLTVTGAPRLDAPRSWVPGDSSQTTLTVHNNLDSPVIISLEAHVQGSGPLRQDLQITAGADSIPLTTASAELATLDSGDTARLPVAVELPQGSSDRSQNESASISFTITASETVDSPGGGGDPDPSTPAPSASPTAPSGGETGGGSTGSPTPLPPRHEAPPAAHPGASDRSGDSTPAFLARTGLSGGIGLAALAATLIAIGTLSLRRAHRTHLRRHD